MNSISFKYKTKYQNYSVSLKERKELLEYLKTVEGAMNERAFRRLSLLDALIQSQERELKYLAAFAELAIKFNALLELEVGK